MRSKSSGIVTDQQVQALAQSWLIENLSLKDAGWKCTAQVVWRILLLAAARTISIYAACRDLAGAPTDQAIGNALDAWLPKRTRTLEEWFEPVLAGAWLPKALFRKARVVAIDWHHIPYHGSPQQHANELRHGPSKSGTTKSHVYATACVVQKGFRYTLAVTSVAGNESPVAVLERLLERLQARGLRVKTLLLDRQFCTSPVMACLQSRRIPYLMPIMFSGRKPKRKRAKSAAPGRRPPVKLRDFRKRAAGRYRFAWTTGRHAVTFDVVVTYKSYQHYKTGRRCSQKLLYAAWRVAGSPVELRELYRLRFGIEASYRQLGQARIRTSTRSPVERMLFVLVALVLRNLWVWLHWTYFSERRGEEIVMHLECLRLRRMLNWIAQVITTALHDGTIWSAQLQSPQ